FDDPELVDAEPVAVYPRPVVAGDKPEPPVYHLLDLQVPLANGRTYQGPVGGISSASVNVRTNEDHPGQTTDTGESPIFDAPPAGLIQEMRFFASRRDRFDDPENPRIPGAWELIMKTP